MSHIEQNNNSGHKIFSKEWFAAQSHEWLVQWAVDLFRENEQQLEQINKILEILGHGDD